MSFYEGSNYQAKQEDKGEKMFSNGTNLPPHAANLAELTRKANAYDRLGKLIGHTLFANYDPEREAGLIVLKEFGYVK